MAVLLTATASLKLLGLLLGTKLLAQIEPLTGASVGDLVLAALLAEVALIVAVLVLPRTTSAGFVAGFGAVVLGYRGWLSWNGFHQCACLGGLFGNSPWMAKNEAGMLTGLAYWLLFSSLSVLLSHRFRSVPSVVSSRRYWTWLPWCALGAAAAVGIVLIARNPIEIGGDEGMEFSKALLLAEQPALASSVWNDQPWFYSQILSMLWNLVGPGWQAARGLSMLLFVGLVLALWRLLPPSAGVGHRLCCLLALVLWPGVLELSTSAMLELPAIGLAVMGAAVCGGSSKFGLRSALLSGLLMGLGGSIKLTALVIFPAFAALVLYQVYRQLLTDAEPVTLARVAASLAPFAFCWFVGFVSMVLPAALLAPRWSLNDLWFSHQLASLADVPGGPSSYRLTIAAVLGAPAIFVGALLGLATFKSGQINPGLVFGAALWLTALVVHSTHVPYWPYYGLHFAIPTALFAGWGWGELRKIAVGYGLAPDLARSLNEPVLLAIATGVALTLSGEMPPIRDWLRGDSVFDTHLVTKLREFKGQVRYGYSRDTAALAQAGVIQVPPLTVLALKRFWTGNLDAKGVFSNVVFFKPEALILAKQGELTQTNWQRWVQQNYVPVAGDDQRMLFIAKQLSPVEMPSVEAILKRIGVSPVSRPMPLNP